MPSSKKRVIKNILSFQGVYQKEEILTPKSHV